MTLDCQSSMAVLSVYIRKGFINYGGIMKRGKNTSVKWKMVSMILLYWALPFALMLALVGHIMADRQEKTGLERMAAQLEMDNQNSIERIDSAISDSRQATYDKTLYSYYDEFRKGSVNFDTVYNKGQYYMAKQYGKRKEISSGIFMLLHAPKVYKMTSYNTPAGGSYNQLKTFWEKDCDDILEFAKDLDTSIGTYQADGRLYLVRNLVDSATYRPWGVLVHRLNLNYCFESLLHFYDNANVKIVLDGKNIVTQGNAEIWKDAPEADTSVMNSLQVKAIDFGSKVTSYTAAVQDNFQGECRVPTFDGMPSIVTGEVSAADAVAQGFEIYAESQNADE